MGPSQTDTPPQNGATPAFAWETHYPAGMQWRASFPQRPLFTLLDEAAERYADRPFLDFLGRKYRYDAARQSVERLAAALQSLGLGRGGRVGLFLPNSPYFVFSYFAVLKAGGTVVAFNPLLGEQELARQLAHSQTELLITIDAKELFSKVVRLRLPKGIVVCETSRALPWPKSLLFLLQPSKRCAIPKREGFLRFHQLLRRAGAWREPARDPTNDIAVLLYTGGTTGMPKGVCLSHASLYANAHQSAMGLTSAQPGRERVVAVLPLSHAFGMTAVMNAGIVLGAELILLPRFQVTELLATIERKKATMLMAVPALFSAILGYRGRRQHDLASLRICSSGGDLLPREVKSAFQELAGCEIYGGYGLTECAPVVSSNPPHGLDKPGSIGVPVPGTVIEIVSAEDRATPLPLGQIGEICIRGPQLMKGYWQDEAATEEALAGGRLHTGDLGYLDEDGYAYLVDRLKDVIISSGYKIYPRWVET
ncbi:MAG: lcfA, partial [Rhodospirillales bacterium]|nr:lcfA [Rhodospirillales bacterium]